MGRSYLTGKVGGGLKMAGRNLGILGRLQIFPRGKHIMVACMPKSASTFLLQALKEVAGFHLVSLHDAQVHDSV